MKRTLLIPAFVASTLLASSVIADTALESMSVKQRIERIERMLSSDVLLSQSQQSEMLQTEISALRELIEQQTYELETIKQRQRSLYLDMDRRLTNLEAGPVNAASSSVPAPNTRSTPGKRPVYSASSGNRASSSDARGAYNAAFDMLKQGRYADSITAFKQFLKQHSGSQYEDNAQYWLAESNYVSREYKIALQEFEKLIANHPDSTKIACAHLKIGYVHYELKNWSAARETLEQVVNSYPDTTVAKKAGERLARMKREGH